MCDANVDMAITHLHKEGKISKDGKFKDGTYYALSDKERTFVDEMAEEICMSTRFISLSKKKLHFESKQKLKTTRLMERITILER